MKRFFGVLLALLVSASLSASAQTAPAARPPKADSAPKMDKPAKVKTAKPAPAMMPSGPGPMKKDGTPDMRYKANRMAKGKM